MTDGENFTISLREAAKRLSREIGREFTHHGISAIVVARDIPTHRHSLNGRAKCLDRDGFETVRRLLVAEGEGAVA